MNATFESRAPRARLFVVGVVLAGLAAVLVAAAVATGEAAADDGDAAGIERMEQLELFSLDDTSGFTRAAGADAYATAAALSERAFPDGADTAYVATRDDFPDGLAGGAVAAAAGAPLLLVAGDEVPSATANELDRLGADDIYVLGGTAAISAEVAGELDAHGEVHRRGGIDRYETAALVAADVDADTAYVATGENFADAVAAGAAAGAEGAPVLLTRADELPTTTADALDELAPDEIVLLGGAAAVSAEVETELEAHAAVERLGGETRYETAQLVAERVDASATTYVTTGEDFADALASAPAAVADAAPVLLTPAETAADAAAAELAARDSDLLVVAGGTAAVADVVVADLLAAVTDEATFFGDTHLHGNYGDDDGPNLARYSQLVADRKAAHGGEGLFVGAGDEYAPSVFAGAFPGEHGKHMIEALNVSELDVTTIGNHEFDYGPENARDRIAESEFPWVSANVRETADESVVFAEEQGASLYEIFEVGDLTVGVTGLGPQGMEEVTSMTDEDGDGAVRIDTDAGLDEAFAAMDAEADVDLRVIASHYSGTDARDLADRRDDVDLIIGDHAAEVLDAPEFRNETAVVLVGDEYDHLAEVTFFLRAGDPVALGWYRHDLDETYPEDPAIRDVMNDWEQRLDEAFDEVIGFRENDWDVRSPDPVRSGESGFANYIVDTIRANVDADVALQNGGGIRSDQVYPGGEDIILRDVIDILPFPNTVVMVEVEGATILEALENGVSNVDAGDGRFPQVSGMAYTWDPDGQAREVDDDGNVVTEGERIVEVTIDGEPLEEDATYTLATNDFMLGGGDGYGMLADGEVLVSPDEGALLSEVVADRIRDEENVTVETDGRISQVE